MPGSFEIPLLAKRLASSGRFDAVICLGALIREADELTAIFTASSHTARQNREGK